MSICVCICVCICIRGARLHGSSAITHLETASMRVLCESASARSVNAAVGGNLLALRLSFAEGGAAEAGCEAIASRMWSTRRLGPTNVNISRPLATHFLLFFVRNGWNRHAVPLVILGIISAGCLRTRYFRLSAPLTIPSSESELYHTRDPSILRSLAATAFAEGALVILCSLATTAFAEGALAAWCRPHRRAPAVDAPAATGTRERRRRERYIDLKRAHGPCPVPRSPVRAPCDTSRATAPMYRCRPPCDNPLLPVTSQKNIWPDSNCCEW